MKIVRNGKKYEVVSGRDVLLGNATFDEARQFLASSGNEDAQKPIVKHSLKGRFERIQEPHLNGEYEFNMSSLV